MKKAERIKKKQEFDDFIKKTKYKKNAFFVIHSNKKREEASRFGIAVGTKIGNAVIRNKLKRRVREIINETKNLFQKDQDYIIIVRKQCLDIDYEQMKEKLTELISR